MGIVFARGPRALLVMLAAVLFALLAEAFSTQHQAVHLHLKSSGAHAFLTVDGTTHTFMWPIPPASLTVSPPPPDFREIGIDGSQLLPHTIDNLDPMYLHTIQSNPYIALDRQIRGEDGYDQWRDVRIVDQTVAQSPKSIPTPISDGSITIPKIFTFDADVYHVERTITLQLAAASHLYQISLDRDNRLVSIIDNSTVGSPLTIVQWYFPADALPYLATNVGTLAHGVVWSAFLIVLAIALGALVSVLATFYPFIRAIGQPRIWPRRSVAAVPALAIGGSFLFTLYIALVEYNGLPHSIDAQAYFFQSKIFAMGRTSIPTPPLSDSIPIPWFGDIRGHWAAQYAPGTV